MPEETLFRSEERLTRTEIATHLRAVAEKLEAGEAVTLTAGEDSVSFDVPTDATFEVKAERETPSAGGPGELSIEFELEWDEGESGEAGGFQVE